MEVITDILQCQNFSFKQKKRGKSIAVVPTMGGLHKGHIALIQKAKLCCEVVIVTIFVNPLQFGEKEDLANYPKSLEKDIAICKQNNVDVVFSPTTEAILCGKTITTFINEKSLTNKLCGLSRPNHFEGVTTIVTKLFNITLPDQAIFGQKDYQQLCIIKKMVKDLNFPIKIIEVPIVREKDGLAFSTRNLYLSEEHREKAPIIFQELTKTKEKIIRLKSLNINETIQSVKKSLQDANIKVDYLQIYDHQSLKPLTNIIKPCEAQMFIAAFLGETRLIDNIFLG